MRIRTYAACAVAAVVLGAGIPACSPEATHHALTIFFDGVPPLAPPPPPPGSAEARAAGAAAPMRAGFREHGPYGAKLCSACHLSTASNSYVEPKQKLCQHCHELDLDKAFVHGPIASDGCTACHDPHSSPYRWLLTGDPATFCFKCHEKEDLARVTAHQGKDAEPCTSCHDPHASDTAHLLRPVQ